MNFTQAGPGDIDRLAPLVAGFHALRGERTRPDQRLAALRPLLENPDLGRIWLIGPSISPVGYLVITFGYSIALGGRDARLDEFFLRENARGKGVGAKILDAIRPFLRDAGVKALWVEAERTDPAQKRLFTRAGFVPQDDRYLLVRRGV